MGAFDDLIPASAPPFSAAGAFDDLIPKNKPEFSAKGSFDDLIPKQDPGTLSEFHPSIWQKLQQFAPSVLGTEGTQVNPDIPQGVIPALAKSTKDFVNGVARPVGKIAQTSGNVLVGATADVGENLMEKLNPDNPAYQQEGKSNTQLALEGKPMPAVTDLSLLPTPARIAGRAAQGLIQTVPQMAAVTALQAVGVPLPVGAAAVFGSTPEGFDPKQAAIAAVLPIVGKYSGDITTSIASKLGVTNEKALDIFHAMGGATGAAGLLAAPQVYEISQLPPEQRKDATIEAVSSIAGQFMLGGMGEREKPIIQPKDIYASGQPSGTGMDIRKQGSGVGEEAPLQQQGQVAGTEAQTQIPNPIGNKVGQQAPVGSAPAAEPQLANPEIKASQIEPQTPEQPISRQSEIEEQDALETVQESVGLNKAQQARLAELQAKNAPASPTPAPAKPAPPIGEVKPVSGSTPPPAVTTGKGGQGVKLAAAMIDAVRKSSEEFRARISNVKYGDIHKNEITFDVDGKPHVGTLKGRNKDFVLGHSKEADAAIAARTFFEGDAHPTPQQGAKGADVGVKPKDALDKAADDARARLSQKRINPGLRSGGIDPTDIDDYAIIAAQHIRNGARTVGELTLKMVKEFGDWIAPHIQDLWDKAKSIGEQKSEPAVSGLMNAFTDEQRKALGMDERSPVERQGHADVFREAEQRMAENPMLGETLLSSLKDHPNREISRVEQVVLMKHKIDVENQYESALKKASENPEDADAKTAADVAGEKVKHLVEISEKIGTESARNLEFRKAMINRDFSLSTMVMEARKTRGWRNLTPDELKEFTDQHNEIQSTEKQRILDEQAYQKALADAEANAKHEEDVAEPKYSKGVLDYAEKFAKYMDKQAVDALARIRARQAEGQMFSGGINPETIDDLAIYGAGKITRGTVDAAKWSAEMIKDLGENIKPYLDKLWKASWAKHDKELGKLDMEKKLGKPMADQIKRAIYKKPTEEVALNRRLTQLEKRATDYKARTVAKDFAPKKKPVSNIQTKAALQKVATSTAKADAAKRAWQGQGERYKFSQLSPVSKAARGVWWAASRLGSTVAVAFHGTVFMTTHAGALAYRPTLAKMYWTNFARQWKLWASPKFYDKMAYEIKTDPLYADAKAAGVGVDPDKTVTDYELYLKSSNKWISRILGGQGALALKLTRMAQYKKEVAKIPDWIRKDPEQLAETKKMLGGMINKATGTTNLFGKLENLSVSKIAHTILFAPKLYASRWARIVVDVPKTLATLSEWSMVRSANKFAGREWKEPSLADKYMAIQRTKHAAEFAATYVAMLAVNQGLNMATGSNQTINAFHPSQSDWLKFKIGGKVVTADGGLLDPVRLIGQIVANDLMPRTAQDRFERGNNFEATVKDLGKYVRGKFSPSFGIIVDDLSGQDFQGRSVPRVAPIPLPRAESQYKSQTPEGIGEYALTKAPIPVADASKLIYDTMRERGLSAPQALTIMAGAATAAMATTGVGVREDYGNKPKTNTGRVF